MIKPLLTLTVLAAALAVPCLQAAERAPLNAADAIQGMGERLPIGKKNVSLSPLFKVYTFEKAGLRFVQINSLKDEVITVLTATPGTEARLPIGTAAEEQMIAVNDAKNQPLGMVTAAASCPCNATVVYRDANTTIVVVYGSNGEYITSYVIKSPQTKPPQ
ncbi:hypothetical protein ACP93_09150 [Xanthomonas sp. NCPPB 1128]|uniref:hypothetical protein n=1 Tax=Xanthomonas sp. NCPPB 1128 TaxID=1775876 RepID=UPI00065A99F6|nr:hypothetical protein [Xanthomonas sp. NCPPB 1128]KMM75806.1 hypothetical protein ACP93_09150 [Xanthomonas sp. NCPPB 1128]